MASKQGAEGEYANLNSAIWNLTEFRDSYFVDNPNQAGSDRDRSIEQKISALFEEIKEKSESESSLTKADFCYFLGKVLNVRKSIFDQKSEEYLSKAVKLNPEHLDAWNELGECLWKKNDLTGAKNCFEFALQKKRNKVSLRNLSMILRQLPKSNEEDDVMKLSFNHAKEAVDLDDSDGSSLYVLGNAYLTYFFHCAQLKPEFIQKALEFYEKAAKDPKTSFNSDLCFNQGVALKYEESYQSALNSFQRAVVLDPSFSSAMQNLNHLHSYLPQIHENVARKGKLKPKRLQELIKLNCSKTDLGPFVGGQYKSTNGLKCELSYCRISELKFGANAAKVCLGRVVASIFNENVIPLTFCIVDECGFCSAVTVYNFNEAFGVTIGQSVAIAEPFFALIKAEINGKGLEFPSIRAPTPEVLVINGRKCGKGAYACTTVAVTKS